MLRAYLSLGGLKIYQRQTHGSHYTDINVDGAEIQQPLGVETGRFYLELNPIDPHLPQEFRDRVVCVISSDTVDAESEQKALLKPGIYTSENGCDFAEIHEVRNGEHGLDLVVVFRCQSLASWSAFRLLVLTGEAKQTRSFEKSAFSTSSGILN